MPAIVKFSNSAKTSTANVAICLPLVAAGSLTTTAAMRMVTRETSGTEPGVAEFETNKAEAMAPVLIEKKTVPISAAFIKAANAVLERTAVDPTEGCKLIEEAVAEVKAAAKQ